MSAAPLHIAKASAAIRSSRAGSPPQAGAMSAIGVISAQLMASAKLSRVVTKP